MIISGEWGLLCLVLLRATRWPPRSTAVLSASAETNPTQRDRHIQVIAEQGRMAWQKTSGYNARAGVEIAAP